MSLARRLSSIFQQKANAARGRSEGPAETLELSYEKMLQNLQRVRKSVAEVSTAEKRIEQQHDALVSEVNALRQQARDALEQGHEDLARTALGRAQLLQAQTEGLLPQIQTLKEQEQKLTVTGQKLSLKVANFRTQRDMLKANYTAAEATTKALEGVTGLSEDMADVSLILQRTHDKVNEMQARATALGELAQSGALESVKFDGSEDDIDMALRQLEERNKGQA